MKKQLLLGDITNLRNDNVQILKAIDRNEHIGFGLNQDLERSVKKSKQ